MIFSEKNFVELVKSIGTKLNQTEDLLRINILYNGLGNKLKFVCNVLKTKTE